jgi:chemotaxis protein MotB
MSIFRGLIPVFIMASLFGCASTKEYNARLADIDGLKGSVSSLEEKLKQTESEKAASQAEAAGLQTELEELNKQNKALQDDNTDLDKLLRAKKDELSVSISELRDKLAEKEKEVNAKNTEIESFKKQMAALDLGKESALKEKERSIVEMKKTYDSLMGEMNQEIKNGDITITQLMDKLSVNFVEQILFDSGSVEIKKNGKKVLDRVAAILIKVTDKQVRVSGHTDNVLSRYRIKEKFPTNWELSTARATTVARYLQDKGINPGLLSACGYSEYRPVASNDTEVGRMKNRRIEMDLIPKEIDKTSQGMSK